MKNFTPSDLEDITARFQKTYLGEQFLIYDSRDQEATEEGEDNTEEPEEGTGHAEETEEE